MNIQTGGAVYASIVAATPLVAANDSANRDVVPVSAPAPAPAAVDPAKLAEAIAAVQRFVQNTTENLNFSVDKTTGKTVVQLVNADTGEVLRQIPSEEMLSIAQALGQMQGLLLREKA